MKPIINARNIICIVVFAVSCLTACSTLPKSKTEDGYKLTLYKSKNAGVSFYYTDVFEEPYESSDSVLFSVLTQNGSFTPNIKIEQFSADGLSTDTLLEEAVVNLRSVFPDYYELERKPIQISEQNGYLWSYDASFNGLQLTYLQSICIQKDTCYLLTFTATPDTFSQYKQDVMKTVESLKIN